MCASIIEALLFIANICHYEKPFVMLKEKETRTFGGYLLTSRVHLSTLLSIPHYAHTRTHTYRDAELND